jgi:calcium/calmodulin-dependent protein kinase (CaM kinase) II
LDLSRRLLDSIDDQDWSTYSQLCDGTLTAFEPEAVGHLVGGMGFHEFYFKLECPAAANRSTISSPHVRVMADSAVVSYIRLVQRVQADGTPVTAAFEETRVWQRNSGRWRHVHFHRSVGAKQP